MNHIHVTLAFPNHTVKRPRFLRPSDLRPMMRQKNPRWHRMICTGMTDVVVKYQKQLKSVITANAWGSNIIVEDQVQVVSRYWLHF